MKNLLVSVLFLLGVTACSDSSTDPDLENGLSAELGEVTLEITGDYQTEKNGTASFWGAGESSFDNDYGHSWQLLTSDELYPDPGILTFRLDFIFLYPDETVSRPEPGSYPIGEASEAEGPDSPVFSSIYARADAGTGFWSYAAEMCGLAEEYSHTGLLTIDTSTPELVTGSFDFEAYYCQDGETETVTITGDFSAPRADLID